MRRSWSFVLAVLFGTAFALRAPNPAWGASPFYEGKTIRYVISMGPGGGFDVYGRLLARHMGRHIPGQPRFIVQNIPGAGSLVAANLIFQEQPGDGLTMVMLHFAAVTQAMVGHPQAKFDPHQYMWIGDPSIGGLPQVIWMRSDIPIRSLADFKNAEKPWRLGSTGVGIGSAMSAEFLKLVGFPINLILGYKSSSDIMLALERKELDGYSISQATMEQVFRRYIDGNVVRPVLSLGKEPRLPPLPGTKPSATTWPSTSTVSPGRIRLWVSVTLTWGPGAWRRKGAASGRVSSWPQAALFFSSGETLASPQ
jgi:tripartite-type tricarboxylate transporter receptor subunit TctC